MDKFHLCDNPRSHQQWHLSDLTCQKYTNSGKNLTTTHLMYPTPPLPHMSAMSSFSVISPCRLVACLWLEITSKADIKCNNVFVNMCAFVLQCWCTCAWNMCNNDTSKDYKPTSLRSQKAVGSVWATCAQSFLMEASTRQSK